MNPLLTKPHRVAGTLRRARERAGLSLRELASRAGTSHSTLSAYEHGRKAPSAATFFRILDACDLAVDLILTPRIRERDGIPRGEELQAVLELAEQFPTRIKRRMDLPVFGRTT